MMTQQKARVLAAVVMGGLTALLVAAGPAQPSGKPGTGKDTKAASSKNETSAPVKTTTAVGSTQTSTCGDVIPQCTRCSGDPDITCQHCTPGYMPASPATSCTACTTIDPNCTACDKGRCTACAKGMGTDSNGLKCIACNTLDPNCTSCSGGKCTACANGLAANLAGQCVKPGTSTCSFLVDNVCCKCQFDCQSYNAATGSCVGAPRNGCGSCGSRQ